ncbi:hypothetical protein BSL78_24534 [Apostichopus japonicus]|uniref:Uncharacterized protein n=1 Tax=Stichopus japonicus TaxID=307972 RepID=A0A2G8JS73_STIJA|nr:hypothetical protein BSL78_24534 [Apostichopus japonicus]
MMRQSVRQPSTRQPDRFSIQTPADFTAQGREWRSPRTMWRDDGRPRADPIHRPNWGTSLTDRRLTDDGFTREGVQRDEFPMNDAFSGHSRRERVQAPPFDGSIPWEDYIVQFELIAELNDWNKRMKALQLAASLRGPAQSILADLEEEKRRDYQAVVNSLEQRFGRANQTELFRALLRNRARKPGESIPELAHDVQRLLARAYPNASTDMKNTLAKEFFVDAIGDSDSRWRIYQARPRNLEEAVSIAVELEAFALAEQKKGNQRKLALRTVVEHKEPLRTETDEPSTT